MMRPNYIGYRGKRSGLWSATKWTNKNRFDPGDVEIGQVVTRYFNRIYRNDELAIIKRPTHPAFLCPISETDIRESLEAVPKRFVTGLAAVIVLGGSRKQEKMFKNTFAYGRYFDGVIIIHPFPRKYLNRRYDVLLKPSDLNEYKRAGATITRDGRGWYIRFDEESLRRFYQRDVLLHELGHHVDAANFRSKSDKKAEGFADWFASEHGYKPRI